MAFAGAATGHILLWLCLLCFPQLRLVGASPIPAGGAGVLESAAPLLVRVESSTITAVEDSEPTVSLTAVPTLAVFTGNADHTSFSDTTSSFTSTVPITTTFSDGHVSTTLNVVSGVITTSVPVAIFGPNGEQVSESSPSKHSIAGFVASIVLGCLAAFLVGAATWRFIYLRRKAASRSKRIPTSGQRKSTQPESDAEVIDPFSDAFRTSWQANGGSELQSSNVDSTQPTSLTHASSISSTRQLYISNQVNRAREKVQELEELSSLLLHSARNSGVSSNRIQLENISEPQDGQGNESTALENRLQRALEEIEGLNLRIQELERQRESDWALGLTDEYPPEYVE
ncbi:hypothetical protein FB45DRAFT_379557 [Roridomyces roridus]|uniref:Mid2 domain-containing protein n=1 Tax=Roridomyces roridus TaxID=1738132 RepID=A0AAD7B2H2_9AGAR|nr:hypothetical protein FB45DRAFT_379557 [Roridomyces roridus]